MIAVIIASAKVLITLVYCGIQRFTWKRKLSKLYEFFWQGLRVMDFQLYNKRLSWFLIQCHTEELVNQLLTIEVPVQ